MERIERLAAQRDTVLAAEQAQDVAGLTAEIDEQVATLQELVGQQAQAVVAAQDVAQEATARADWQAQDLTAARAEIERIATAAAQAAALTNRESTIERQSMQAALERQIDRHTELKAMLDYLKPLASMGATQPPAENSAR